MSAVLTHTMRLNPQSDLAREQERFRALLHGSAIPPQEWEFLDAQVESALAQYRRQLALNGGKRYAMRRDFEGEGYRITIHIGENALSKLLHFWRG